MKAYETSATVDAEGQLRLSGVPFAPGTQVEVTISPMPTATLEESAGASDETVTAAHNRMRELFAALDQARNTEAVGPLRREQLYDRDGLR
jgi:hypothetical protein